MDLTESFRLRDAIIGPRVLAIEECDHEEGRRSSRSAIHRVCVSLEFNESSSDPFFGSCQSLRHDLPADIGQAEIAALELIGQLFVVQAEQMQ